MGEHTKRRLENFKITALACYIYLKNHGTIKRSLNSVITNKKRKIENHLQISEQNTKQTQTILTVKLKKYRKKLVCVEINMIDNNAYVQICRRNRHVKFT